MYDVTSSSIIEYLFAAIVGAGRRIIHLVIILVCALPCLNLFLNSLQWILLVFQIWEILIKVQLLCWCTHDNGICVLLTLNNWTHNLHASICFMVLLYKILLFFQHFIHLTLLNGTLLTLLLYDSLLFIDFFFHVLNDVLQIINLTKGLVVLVLQLAELATTFLLFFLGSILLWCWLTLLLKLLLCGWLENGRRRLLFLFIIHEDFLQLPSLLVDLFLKLCIAGL